MKRLFISIQIVIAFSFTVFSQTQLHLIDIGDLHLISGKIIEDCQMGYRTFGQLNEDESNVIIYPTWFGGTSESIGSLVGKHHFIDTTKYYIIALDALGDGLSSSPSNYDKEFPQITIRDMVNAEFKLLTEFLDIQHIFAAVGGSLGSMQVLEWAVTYPDFMDKIVAYVASPKMTSYDLLWLNTQVKVIESFQKCGMTEKEIQNITDLMTATMAHTPDYVVENIKTENFSEYLSSFDKAPSKIFTSTDYVAQLKAIMNHDISKNFNGSMKETAKAIKADLFIIVSKYDMMVNPAEALKLADLTGARKLILDSNCGHLAVSCELEKCSKEIANFFDQE